MRWIPRTSDPAIRDLRRIRDHGASLAALGRVAREVPLPGDSTPGLSPIGGLIGESGYFGRRR